MGLQTIGSHTRVGMATVTSVETRRAAEAAAAVDDLDEDTVRKIFMKFRELDTNHDGQLGFTEMRTLLLRGNPRFTEKYLKTLYHSISGSLDGKVDFMHFLRFVFAPRGESSSSQKARKKVAAQQKSKSARQVEIFGASLTPEVNGIYRRGDQDFNGRPVFEKPTPLHEKPTPLHVVFYSWTHDKRLQGWFIAESGPKECPVSKYLMFNPSPVAQTPDQCCATWESSAKQRDNAMCLTIVESDEWDDACTAGSCLPHELFSDAEQEARDEAAEFEHDIAELWERETQEAEGEMACDVDAEWIEMSPGPRGGRIDMFVDHDFPPGNSSLGGVEGSGVECWRRLSEINSDACLFKRIAPEDIVSTDRPSNAWFTAAVAVVAEYPGWIQSMFGNWPFLHPDGRYTVRLYHPGRKAFVRVTVDDYVPTSSGSPSFTGISAMGELWPALLEKAFAKLNGSYKAIGWGSAAFGLLYLCGGGAVESWSKTARGTWARSVTQWRGLAGATINRKRAEGSVSDDTQIGQATLWLLLRRHMKANCPVALGVDKSAAWESNLRLGLPYSLVCAREVPVQGKTLRMLRVRNGLGATFFKGRWADGSEAWSQCPVAQQRLRFKPKGGQGDGTFWMSYSDFLKYFDRADCARQCMPIQGCRGAKCHRSRLGL